MFQTLWIVGLTVVATVGFLFLGVLVSFKPENQKKGFLYRALLFLISPICMLYYGAKKMPKSLQRVVFLLLNGVAIYFVATSLPSAPLAAYIAFGLFYLLCVCAALVDEPPGPVKTLLRTLVATVSIWPVGLALLILYGAACVLYKMAGLVVDD